MKGVLLTGGTGTRLKPYTNFINKHLLSVAGKPMLEYPLRTLQQTVHEHDIAIIYNDERIKYLGTVYTYIYQKEPSGIAAAAKLAEEFIGGEEFLVLLGDNFFKKPLELIKPPQVWAAEIPNRGLTILGAYYFDSRFFAIETVPSSRGEHEMIDILSGHGPVQITKVNPEDWVDMGTPEGIAEAEKMLK